MHLKKIIKTIIIILVFLFPFSAFSNWQGSGTDTDPYLIFDIVDLQAVADSVSKGNIFNANFHFKLMSDIPGPVDFLIGAGSPTNRNWNHKFDGNGFKITLLRSGGLFPRSSTNSVIKDLSVDGIIYNASGITGGITNRNRNIISNVTNYTSVQQVAVGWTAGIVGVNEEGASVIGSINNGKIVSNTSYLAGIAAESVGIVSNCINTGSIISTPNVPLDPGENSRVGGIVGSISGTTPASQVVVESNINTGFVQGEVYVGGIVGANFISTPPVSILINKNINYGLIRGDMRIGGILGGNQLGFDNRNTATISNNSNFGVVIGNSNVGCIVGIRQHLMGTIIIENNHYDKRMSGDDD